MPPYKERQTISPSAVLAYAVAVIAVIIAVHQWHERRTTEAAFNAARAQLDEMQKWQSKKEVSPIDIQRIASSEEPVPVGNQGGQARQYQQNLARQRAMEAQRGAAAQIELMSSQEMQGRIVEYARRNVPLRYGAFYSAMNMSDVQIRMFERAMVDKVIAVSDVLIASRMVGSTDQETKELRERQLSVADDMLKQALGDSLYTEWLRYDGSADSRPLVEALAGKLFYSDDRLSSQQGEQLSRLVASNHRSDRNNGWLHGQALVGPDSAPSWHEINWDGVLLHAQIFLSEKQVGTLRTMSESAELRRGVQQRLSDADRKARTTPDGRK